MKSRILFLAALCFTQSMCTTVTSIRTPDWTVEVSHGPFSEETIHVIATNGKIDEIQVNKRTDAAGVAAAGTAVGGLIGAAVTAAVTK